MTCHEMRWDGPCSKSELSSVCLNARRRNEEAEGLGIPIVSQSKRGLGFNRAVGFHGFVDYFSRRRRRLGIGVGVGERKGLDRGSVWGLRGEFYWRESFIEEQGKAARRVA